MHVHLLEAQDKIANTLREEEEQRSIDRYMTDLKICTKHDLKFNSWLLSIEKVSKLTGLDPSQFVSLKMKVAP